MSWTLSLLSNVLRRARGVRSETARKRERRNAPVDGDGHERVDEDADGHGVHEVGQLAHQLAELPVCAQRPTFRFRPFPSMCRLSVASSYPIQRNPPKSNNDYIRTAARSVACPRLLVTPPVCTHIVLLYSCVRDADLCVESRCVACARLLVTPPVRTAPYSAPAQLGSAAHHPCPPSTLYSYSTRIIRLIDLLNELLSAPTCAAEGECLLCDLECGGPLGCGCVD